MLGRASAAVGRFAPVSACVVLCLTLAHCSSSSNVDPRYGVSASPRVVDSGEPVPKGGGVYRVGAPYMVGGRMYVPEADPHYRAEGLASWYGQDFHGRLTANGEVFDLGGISAAHPTLPLPSYARVTNLSNGRSLVVRVNDRGPYHSERIIDLSMRASQLLGYLGRGTAWVRVEYLGRAPMDGTDDRILEATLRQDEPAPYPGSVRTARAHSVPQALVSAPPRNPRFASAAANDAVPEPAAARAMSYAGRTSGMDGTVQFLNGHGLY
jgi:peptidoglycan lytic transglycosylase